jgi:protein phosphatase
MLLDITNPVTVVGDLHGQILDLYRILQVHGLPHSTKYLFLGDFVDRGDFSFELVTLVFLLKVLFRENVYIIRGNHEFEDVCATGGFGQELTLIFHNTLVFYSFINAFAMIPIACLIDRNVLAVHGGISQDMANLSDLNFYKRPIHNFEDALMTDLLWADPSQQHPRFSISRRGMGYDFGEEATHSFLETMKLKGIIRAHEMIAEGVVTLHDGLVTTVFSTSTGAETGRNKIGFVQVTERCEIRATVLDPGLVMTREEALFKDFLDPGRILVNAPLAKAKSNFVRTGLLIAKLHPEANKKPVLSRNRSLTVEGLHRRLSSPLLSNSRK